MGQVYIIHLSLPFGHARHYTGWVKGDSPREPFRRLVLHKKGKGSKFLIKVDAAGIPYKLVRVFTNRTRYDEKSIKKRACRLCPICKAERKAGKQLNIFNITNYYSNASNS